MPSPVLSLGSYTDTFTVFPAMVGTEGTAAPYG